MGTGSTSPSLQRRWRGSRPDWATPRALFPEGPGTEGPIQPVRIRVGLLAMGWYGVGGCPGAPNRLAAVLLTVFRSAWGFGSDGTLKNPVNAGENALEPVVGIGQFHSMNTVKIADFSRKSTSLTQSLPPSITLFS